MKKRTIAARGVNDVPFHGSISFGSVNQIAMLQ